MIAAFGIATDVSSSRALHRINDSDGIYAARKLTAAQARRAFSPTRSSSGVPGARPLLIVRE